MTASRTAGHSETNWSSVTPGDSTGGGLVDGSAAAGARAALEHAIKSLIGVSCRVKVEPTNAIERSGGKARRVIDRRPR